MRVAAPEDDAVGQNLLDGPAVDLLPLFDTLDMRRLAVLDQGMALLRRQDGADQGEVGVGRRVSENSGRDSTPAKLRSGGITKLGLSADRFSGSCATVTAALAGGSM